MNIAFFDNNISASGWPSVWCIACMKGRSDYDKFVISYDESEIFDLENYNTWLEYLKSLGLDFEITSNKNTFKATFSTKIYSDYTKVVTVLSLFRCIFNKYSSLGIFENMIKIKKDIPELQFIQAFQLAHFVATRYGIDHLHHPIEAYTSLINEDIFKKRFITSPKLTKIFRGKKEISKQTVVDYLNDVKIYKSELLKTIL